MSWKFAGILFQHDYQTAYPALLHRLEVNCADTATGFTFAEAIDRENQMIALGFVNGITMLLHHLLPYNCSYEPGEQSRLDEQLAALAHEGDILNYIVDGVSGTYCFSLFSQGVRTRRWATAPGNAWCNEGPPIPGEMAPAPTHLDPDLSLPAPFTTSADEAHLFAVWEAFLGITFQELVQNKRPFFRLFY